MISSCFFFISCRIICYLCWVYNLIPFKKKNSLLLYEIYDNVIFKYNSQYWVLLIGCFILKIKKSKLVILTSDLIYSQQEQDIYSPAISDQHSNIVNNSCIFSYGFPSKVLFCEFLRNYFHIWVCVFLFHLYIFILSKLFIHPHGIEVILDLLMKRDNHLRWTSSLRVLWITFKSNTLMSLANLIKVFYNLCSSIFSFNAFLVLFNKMEGMGIENLGLWIHVGAIVILHY